MIIFTNEHNIKIPWLQDDGARGTKMQTHFWVLAYTNTSSLQALYNWQVCWNSLGTEVWMKVVLQGE